MLLLLACLIYTLLPGRWAIRVIAVISHKILIQIKRWMKTARIFVEHETGTKNVKSIFEKLQYLYSPALDWCHCYFFQTTFCKAMLLNVALDRQGESFDLIRDLFFRTWSPLEESSFLGFGWKVFSNHCCFKIPSTLGNVKRDSESQVSQASVAQCLVYVELRTLGWCLPNCQITQCFSAFLSVLPRPCSVYVGMLKRELQYLDAGKQATWEKKRPIFMISSSSVLSFTGDDFLQGCHVFRWLTP